MDALKIRNRMIFFKTKTQSLSDHKCRKVFEVVMKLNLFRQFVFVFWSVYMWYTIRSFVFWSVYVNGLMSCVRFWTFSKVSLYLRGNGKNVKIDFARKCFGFYKSIWVYMGKNDRQILNSIFLSRLSKELKNRYFEGNSTKITLKLLFIISRHG